MEKLIHIKHQGIQLEGMLNIPSPAQGIVLFAHGSGSSRLSPRNTFVATVLNQAKLATLLIDLLSKEEDAIYQTRFDIDLLTNRLNGVIHWLKEQPDTRHLQLGVFGASTGAAAALKVASQNKEVKAVVSRGGRPDLTMHALAKVTAPTLLIIGGNDPVVIKLNQEAYAQLKCIKKWKIIPHATHLFEEPGALEEVARLAAAWFTEHLSASQK